MLPKGRPIAADLAEKAVLTIKMLAVDAVEKAKSGHPGMPMGAADYAFQIWARHLRFCPADPAWPNRDRFVLSAGHGSMLLYALLHLAGYDVSLDDLKKFRQLGSKTPGHPEVGLTPGVECTTGPLGQGFGNGVGMALAAKMLAARFNAPDETLVDSRVFGIVSDGDLMEGVASEAASMAGHLGLGNLKYVYDDNHITIGGDTRLTFSEDVGKRFEAYGWFVQHIDGHDAAAIERALDAAVAEAQRPSLVIARTHIAHGSPNKHDTAESHGAPLGAEEILATKKHLGWPVEPTFLVPEDVRALFAARVDDLSAEHADWQRAFDGWVGRHPDLAALWRAHHERAVPPIAELVRDLVAAVPAGPAATRVTGGRMMQVIARKVPALCGGSADLEPSTMTLIDASRSIARGDFSGVNIHFGIREHAMGAVLNGLALSGGFLPFGATFLVFSDYMRPSIRLAALSHAQVVYVFTHDSVLLGEDGPTHQPIEHLGALRLIPNLLVYRPADAIEVAAAWTVALHRKRAPTALALTRQKVPPLDRDAGAPADAALAALRGGYVVGEARGGPAEIVLIASGSEVWVAAEARKILGAAGLRVRLVSMPAPDLFAEQDEAYRRAVLPAGVRRVSIEAGRTEPWKHWVGESGLALGIDGWGASAPEKDLAEFYGLTPQKVADRVAAWWAGGGTAR